MDARVNYVVLPIGKQLMREDQAALASMEGYLAVVLMHEICHGLGPAMLARLGQGGHTRVHWADILRDWKKRRLISSA